ncbi:MAG: DUF1223 domain-containing protein [Gammaproteobacteria bacterium]
MNIQIQLLLTTCLLLSVQVVSAAQEYHASSPSHRVAVLELYTSEGCSSCPPADAWLSKLKHTTVADTDIVPLAFHVTYWDYIGWRDRYADSRYDDRQREIGRFNSSRTIYTPQFVLNGADYRRRSRFDSDLDSIGAQKALVDIELSAIDKTLTRLDVELVANIARSPVKDVALYLAVYENNLASDVNAGENEGETLKHDFVVRKLYGPFIQSQPQNRQRFAQTLELGDDWKRMDLNLAVFAQNPHTGEVLQAVRLELK